MADHDGDSSTLPLSGQQDTAPILPPFLALPRELRNQVYEHFLVHRAVPFAKPTLSDHHYTYVERRGFEGRGTVHENQVPNKAHAINLSLVCHQLREEILEIIHGHISKGQTAIGILDLATSDNAIWPVWRELPLFRDPRRPMDLFVNLRLFTAMTLKNSQQSSSHWNFIWDHLLVNPTAGRRSDRSLSFDRTHALVLEQINLQIRKLTLRICVQDDYTPEEARALCAHFHKFPMAHVVSFGIPGETVVLEFIDKDVTDGGQPDALRCVTVGPPPQKV